MQKFNGFLLCFSVVAISVISTEGFSIGDFNDQRCDQSKICTLIYEPVCGSDGKTYGNECVLSRCPGLKVAHEGECTVEREEASDDGCDQTKICHLLDAPVCGSDGKTYGNDCELSRCPGVTLVHEGECQSESRKVDDDGCDGTKICHLLDEPVCGSDGKTYGNDCELSRCPGVTLVHEGECKRR